MSRTAKRGLDREVYNKLVKQYPGQIISPHELRLEAVITNSASTYTFNVLEDTGGKTSTEIRLNKNDLMFVTDLGYGLAAIPTDKPSKAEIATYANENIFIPVVVSSVTTFDPTDLEVFWKAVLLLKVKVTEYIPGLYTDVFKDVPQQQKSSATTYDEYNSESGFLKIPTYYALRGTDQIVWQLQVQTYAGILVANTNAGFENRVILRPRGFIIRQGAALNPLDVE